MNIQQDNNIDFVTRSYQEGRFNTDEAIRRFHSKVGDKRVHSGGKKWWAAVAAVFASVFVLFAGGYGIYGIVQTRSMKAQKFEPKVEEQSSASHFFVFDNTPLNEVLDELSSYYGRSLTAPSTDKRLTASFPEDDLEVVVATIEAALDIDIVISE